MTRQTILIVLLSVACVAQKAPPDHFLLSRINVTGSQRYSQAELISALQLKTGTQVSQKDLEAASQRLGNSGLFQVVQYQFGWQPGGVVATFSVIDGTGFVPIGFENFVWLSPEEMKAQIKSKLPLFTGEVPLAGSLKDQIQQVLQQWLAAHNLHGTVSATPQGELNRPVQAMLYGVEGNAIHIGSCDFPGADHADKEALSRLIEQLQKSSYESSFVEKAVKTQLRDIYNGEGYLAANISSPQVKVISQTPDETVLALTATVQEGRIYKYAGSRWAGNTRHSSDELTKLVAFPIGAPASIPKFGLQLDLVHRLYGRDGYVGMKSELTPELDPQGTAIFNVTLREGPQYHMGTMQVRGVTPQLLAKMLEEWKLTPGAIYDASYAEEYMATKFGKWIPAGTRIEWHNRETIHDDTRIVDVLLEIAPRPRS